MKLLILTSLLSTLAYSSFASVGTFVHYFNQEQVSESGETKKFELNPYFGYGHNFALTQSHYFVPEIAYCYIMSSEEDVREDIIFLNYHFSYYISPRLLIKYGLTTYWWRITGTGGRKRLNNGNGTTNFKLPNKTVTSYVSALTGGLESFIDNQKSLRFDLQMMDSINDENMSFNYLLTVNFYL